MTQPGASRVTCLEQSLIKYSALGVVNNHYITKLLKPPNCLNKIVNELT